MDEELKVIITAEIDKLKSEIDKAKKEVENFTKKSHTNFKAFNEEFQKVGTSAKNIMKTVGVAFVGATTALLGLTASTKEYRENQAKLTSAFETAGASAETAKQVYNDLYKVIGEDDRAVETANHLAQLTTNQAELSEWTNICQGVWATFGDSLPIEGLTEASNETAKVGQVTGVLADALNWAGISEDDFNKKLSKLNTEAEREALIRTTLNGLYNDASAKYAVNNAEVLKQNEAQAKLNEQLGKVGKALAPVLSALTELGADILADLTPYIEQFAKEHLPKILEKLEGVGDKIGKVITWIVDNWSFLTTLGGIILGVATAISVVSTVMAVVNAVMMASPVTWIVLAIVGAVTALVAIIVLCVKNFDKIKEVGRKAWEGIKNAWNSASTWFSNIFTKASNGIKNAFSSITSFFSGVWSKIKSIFSNVGTAIATGIKGAVSGAVNAVLKTATGIINGFISAINVAIGVINAIPGVNISKLKKLSVPAMAEGGIVNKATLAMIGENGSEAVMPLENNLGWLDKLAGMLNDRMGGSGRTPIVLQVDGKTFAQMTVDSINDLTKHRGSLPLIFA